MFAMKRSVCSLLMVAAGSTLALAQDFTETVTNVLSKTDAKALSVAGETQGWFFLRRELEHLQVGDLAKVDLSEANKNKTDPVPVIAKYAQELKDLGVELLLVPVPPKAAIYPKHLAANVDSATVPGLADFLAKLKAEGVEVLDLEAEFRKHLVEKPEVQLYCSTDSHWSPYACELVAGLVAERFKALQQPDAGFKVLDEEKLEFLGDLIEAEQKAGMEKEVLPLRRAGKADAEGVSLVEGDVSSPLVVIGDSHLQVFRRGGAMLATQAGFIDHLQARLNATVQEFSMQAGGADGPRREVARATVSNPDFWKSKKAVVWLFTAREFTQGRWKELPAQVKRK